MKASNRVTVKMPLASTALLVVMGVIEFARLRKISCEHPDYTGHRGGCLVAVAMLCGVMLFSMPPFIVMYVLFEKTRERPDRWRA